MAEYTIAADLTADKFKIRNVSDADQKKFLQADGSLGEVNVTYTNDTPTPQKIGGIEEGTKFTGKTVTEMFNMLLYPYIYPTATLTVSPTTIEANYSTPITAELTNITKGTNSIASYYIGTSAPDSNTTYGSTTKITKSITTATTFYASIKDSEGKTSSTMSKTVNVGYRFFFGTLSATSFTEDQLTDTTLKTAVPKGDYTIKGDTTKKYVYLVYPSSWTITVKNMGATFNDYTPQESGITYNNNTYTVLKFNPEYKAGSTTFTIV